MRFRKSMAKFLLHILESDRSDHPLNLTQSIQDTMALRGANASVFVRSPRSSILRELISHLTVNILRSIHL